MKSELTAPTYSDAIYELATRLYVKAENQVAQKTTGLKSLHGLIHDLFYLSAELFSTLRFDDVGDSEPGAPAKVIKSAISIVSQSICLRRWFLGDNLDTNLLPQLLDLEGGDRPQSTVSFGNLFGRSGIEVADKFNQEFEVEITSAMCAAAEEVHEQPIALDGSFLPENPALLTCETMNAWYRDLRLRCRGRHGESSFPTRREWPKWIFEKEKSLVIAEIVHGFDKISPAEAADHSSRLNETANLDANAMKILEELGKLTASVTQQVLAAKADVHRRTVYTHLKILKKLGLVARPPGMRRGIVITDSGRNLLTAH